MEVIGDIWNAAIIRPMINSLIVIYAFTFSNFGVTIIFFTILIRVVLVPLTVKQSRQMKAMSALQPKLKEIQEKYKNDRQRASKETMSLYRQQGVNPLGCLGPLFIQFPIWIGLYQSVIQTLPSTPERLADLSRHLYSWLPQVHEVVPLNGQFLWLDLAFPDPSPIVLPLLVGASMWLMQKMTTMPSGSPTQESTNRMMLWMMPVMFGFFTLNFPSGLALYWIVSNIIGVVIQGFVTGWGPLLKLVPATRPKDAMPAPAVVPAAEEPATVEETATHANNRNDRQNARGGYRTRSKGARRRSRGGRGRRR